MKIKSADALAGIRQKALQELSVREAGDHSENGQSCGLEKGASHMQILCCGGTGCKASDSAKIVDNFRESLSAHGIADKVEVIMPMEKTRLIR